MNKHKIDDADYKLLQETKKKQEKAAKANEAYQKEMTIMQLKMRISQLERQRAFQERQIATKEILEKDERFVDGKKAIFVIENDLDKTALDLWNYRKQLEEIQKED